MTPKEALEALDALPTDDPELQHLGADIILCKLLGHAGYSEVVQKYLALATEWEYA
jgi:hypothetical protein